MEKPFTASSNFRSLALCAFALLVVAPASSNAEPIRSQSSRMNVRPTRGPLRSARTPQRPRAGSNGALLASFVDNLSNVVASTRSPRVIVGDADGTQTYDALVAASGDQARALRSATDAYQQALTTASPGEAIGIREAYGKQLATARRVASTTTRRVARQQKALIGAAFRGPTTYTFLQSDLSALSNAVRAVRILRRIAAGEPSASERGDASLAAEAFTAVNAPGAEAVRNDLAGSALKPRHAKQSNDSRFNLDHSRVAETASTRRDASLSCPMRTTPTQHCAEPSEEFLQLKGSARLCPHRQ